MNISKKFPIIGIPINSKNTQSNFDSKEIYYINDEYCAIISKLGGLPILLPYTNNEELIIEQVNMCDGILLPGGDDITPYLYGEEPNLKLGECNEEMDCYHISLAKETIRVNKPILGICRGIQLLNIIHGGSVYMDISYFEGTPILHMQVGRRKDLCHMVDFTEGSKLHQYFGDSILTNSYHHQAVSRIGEGLEITARTRDGLIEGIENHNLKYCVGVQWHPEIMAMHTETMHPLFSDFIEHCRN